MAAPAWSSSWKTKTSCPRWSASSPRTISTCGTSRSGSRPWRTSLSSWWGEAWRRLKVERAANLAQPRLFIKTVIARAYPRVVAQHRRERSWLLFEVILPMLAVSASLFIYRAIGAPGAYVGFVVMGGAMTAFWMNVLWGMSSQFFWEKETANLALYTIAPKSTMAILLVWA